MAQTKLRWAVIGVGIAGRARARAIMADPRCELTAVHRGRFAGSLGVRELPLEDAIAAADAVAVCSPTALHPAHAHAALRAGRHVVVEFPLAPDPVEAAGLLDLAAERGRILHTEHIELLDAAQVTLRAQARPELIRSLSITFERQGDDRVDPGMIALHNVARLHRLIHLAGPVLSIDTLRSIPGGLQGTLTLAGAGHGAPPIPAHFRFVQTPDLTRRTHLVVQGQVDHWTLENRVLFRNGQPQTLLSGRSLFERDHRHAVARIIDGRAPYVSDERILHVLDVVAALGGGHTGTINGREQLPAAG